MAGLIGFGFQEISRQNENEITYVSAIASVIFLSLIGAIDVGTGRKNVNIKLTNFIGFIASLLVSLIFAIIPIRINYYYITMGMVVVFVFYIISLLSSTE
jgi:hypothetical protein